MYPRSLVILLILTLACFASSSFADSELASATESEQQSILETMVVVSKLMAQPEEDHEVHQLTAVALALREAAIIFAFHQPSADIPFSFDACDPDGREPCTDDW